MTLTDNFDQCMVGAQLGEAVVSHVHWLRSYHVDTTFGETFCGFRGMYLTESRYLVFSELADRTFDATTAFCEVTCAKCARYRLSYTKIEIEARKAEILT